MAKVVRVICYEGDEEAVRDAIRRSMPLGRRDCQGYVMTIGEHYNDLPQLAEVAFTDQDIHKALES